MTATSVDTWTKRLAHGWHTRRRGPVLLDDTDARPAYPVIHHESGAQERAGRRQGCVPAGWSALGGQCATDSWRCCPGTMCADTTDGTFGTDRIACR